MNGTSRDLRLEDRNLCMLAGMAMTQKLPVLVTGGAGYIGSHAVLALADAGWPVR
jgi:hypothetical protein